VNAWAPALGLLAAPALAVAAALLFPGLVVSPGVAAALTFGGAAGAALLSLSLAARADLAPRAAAGLLAAGVALVGAAFLAAARPVLAVALVDLGLVAAAHAVGGSIGRRVAHPGHLLPACAVAAAADLASVIHPAGPSHAIAASERALSLLAVGFPVPGTDAVAPALGVGDLMFLALLLGVAAAHRFSIARVALAAAVGLAVAGGLAGALQREIPALIPLGAAVVALVPEARRLRPEDRRTAAISVTLAAAVALGVLLSPH
jgi:hypothetical protein